MSKVEVSFSIDVSNLLYGDMVAEDLCNLPVKYNGEVIGGTSWYLTSMGNSTRISGRVKIEKKELEKLLCLQSS